MPFESFGEILGNRKKKCQEVFGRWHVLVCGNWGTEGLASPGVCGEQSFMFSLTQKNELQPVAHRLPLPCSTHSFSPGAPLLTTLTVCQAKVGIRTSLPA